MSSIRWRLAAAFGCFVAVAMVSGSVWAEGSDDLGTPTGVACDGEQDCADLSFCSGLGVCAMSWDDCQEGDGICQGLNGEGNEIGTTTLRVEILDADETFVYTGPGTARVQTPAGADLNGSLNGDNVYDSGETITPEAGQTGAYRVVLQARDPCDADQCEATYDCEQNEGAGGCNSFSIQNNMLLSGVSVFYAWDITVFDTDGTTPIDGRVWSRSYAMNAGTFARDRATNTSFYALVPGGVAGANAVVELRFDGLAGFIWNLFVNRIGPLDATGVARGRSVFGSAFLAFGGFPVYLNEPDPDIYTYTPVRQDCTDGGAECVEPSVEGFEFVGGPGDVACGGVLSTDDLAVGGTFAFDTNVEGTYQVYCDLDGDGASIVDIDDLVIIGSIDPEEVGNACNREGAIVHCDVLWDGLDSAGEVVPAGQYVCRVRIAVGEIHYVGRDMETSFEGMRLFEAPPGEVPRGLDMFWNDTLVQNAARPMLNDEVGAETSGADGISAGLSGDATVPHTEQTDGNARAWGKFTGGCNRQYRGGPPTAGTEDFCFCEVYDGGSCTTDADCPDDIPCFDRLFSAPGVPVEDSGICADLCHASKGDVALLDTFTWVAAASVTLAEVLTVYDGTEDETDGDGVPTYWELCVFETDPDNNDSDGDSVSDFVEVGGQDGIDDFDAPNTDDDDLIDALDDDDDGDGIATVDEDVDGDGGLCTEPGSNAGPCDDDTDGDGIVNYLDPNDNDGPLGDLDDDTILNDDDNCPTDANTEQTDTNDDGEGDACDDDIDGDDVLNDDDNCPTVQNGDQTDTDDDDEGDACDDDIDGDTILNDDDNCPTDANTEQTDTNDDGEGDACDDDIDGDDVLNDDDNCPTVQNGDQTDTDDDDEGDACDDDIDGDDVLNDDDNCPVDPNGDQNNVDDDDFGDACDDDIDGDDILNDDDNCPTVANPNQQDTNDDGIGDACEADGDEDGVPDAFDNCPDVANDDQADGDDDGVGDVCDNCPDVANANGQDADLDEDGIGDACDDDRDGDGLTNGDEENVHLTDPDNPDTDGGGVDDGDEIDNGTNPLDPSDDGGVDVSGGQFFGCSMTGAGGRHAEGAWLLAWIGLGLTLGLGRRRWGRW